MKTPEEWAEEIIRMKLVHEGKYGRSNTYTLVTGSKTITWPTDDLDLFNIVKAIRVAAADVIRQAQADALASPLPSPVDRETLEQFRQAAASSAPEPTGTLADGLHEAIQSDLQTLFRHIDHLEHLLAEAAQDASTWSRMECYQRGFEDGRKVKGEKTI